MPISDRDIRLAVLNAFLGGEVPTPAAVAASLGIPDADAAAAFERLAEGRAFVLYPGTRDIRMAAPFAARPSGFAVTIGGKAVEANCIWDALGIPAMTGRDADIRTNCPCCGEALALSVRDGTVSGDDGVAHFAVPAAHWWDDIAFT